MEKYRNIVPIPSVEEIQLILGDCLEEMKKIPDKSIDLVLTDPPYGLNIAKSGCLSIKGASDKRAEFTPSAWEDKCLKTLRYIQ